MVWYDGRVSETNFTEEYQGDKKPSRGLALETMISVLTIKYVQLFLILWIISKYLPLDCMKIKLNYSTGNVSVCLWPPEMLPSFYRYAYAAPFYHLSRGVRTIVFSTKNERESSFYLIILRA